MNSAHCAGESGQVQAILRHPGYDFGITQVTRYTSCKGAGPIGGEGRSMIFLGLKILGPQPSGLSEFAKCT